MKIDKADVVAAAIGELEAERDRMHRFAEETRKAATHEEARPENDKDTRGLEQSYLARGQAMRVEDLGESIQLLRFMTIVSAPDVVQVGTLVTVLNLDDDLERTLFVAPVGGVVVEVSAQKITLIHTNTPMGRALLGKREGDDFVLKIAGREREFEVVTVR